MTELTLSISNSADLVLVQQLAQRLGIPYAPKIFEMPKSASSLKRPAQSEIFVQMEILRLKMKSFPARPDIDISALANEVNAI